MKYKAKEKYLNAVQYESGMEDCFVLIYDGMSNEYRVYSKNRQDLEDYKNLNKAIFNCKGYDKLYPFIYKQILPAIKTSLFENIYQEVFEGDYIITDEFNVKKVIRKNDFENQYTPLENKELNKNLEEDAIKWYTKKTINEILKLYEESIALKIKQDNCPHDNIEYCSTYEMRNNDMYCRDCKKHGSREELRNKL